MLYLCDKTSRLSFCCTLIGIQPAGGGQIAGVGGKVAVIVGGAEVMVIPALIVSRVAGTVVGEGSIMVGEFSPTVPSNTARDKLPRTTLEERMAIPSPKRMERSNRT